MGKGRSRGPSTFSCCVPILSLPFLGTATSILLATIVMLEVTRHRLASPDCIVTAATSCHSTARPQHSHGTATSQSRHSHSTATAQPQHSHSTVTAQSQHSHGTGPASAPRPQSVTMCFTTVPQQFREQRRDKCRARTRSTPLPAPSTLPLGPRTADFATLQAVSILSSAMRSHRLIPHRPP